jgi:2-keto-4-pentenoate hydratase/2-oxohepta-3-ene-1,7-dioic acid hydratase in catechol pathway
MNIENVHPQLETSGHFRSAGLRRIRKEKSMKLCTFTREGKIGVGLLLAQAADPAARILELASPETAAALGFSPACLEDVIASHLDAVRGLAERQWSDSACVALGSVRLLAPLGTRSKVIGVARNFRCAVAEQKSEIPASPFWFSKMPNTIIGDKDPVRLGENIGNVTYEGEVGLVIGKRARDIAESDAVRHIAGYTLVNDVSGSSLIKEDNGNFFRGKNVDTFCPMGPFFVTADEIPDPHNLRIRLQIDGRTLQDGSTANMIFNMFALVSRLSRTVTLEPGDVIATGTPAGAAAMQTPPAWLRDGQVMRLSVEGLGVLENPVRAFYH